MIKASSSVIEKEQDGKKYIRADLLSDTKEEIESMGINGDVVEGFSDNVIIAPNSVVVKDVPDNTIVSGIPAKVLKNIS